MSEENRNDLQIPDMPGTPAPEASETLEITVSGAAEVPDDPALEATAEEAAEALDVLAAEAEETLETPAGSLEASVSDETEELEEGTADSQDAAEIPATGSEATDSEAEKQYDIPSVDELAQEYKRARYQDRYRRTLLNTIFTLITVAASAILVATLWMPVLRIYGNSMEATLYEGDIVATVKTENLDPGDIVAFYYNNQVLVKRFIAGPGEWVDIDDHGNVYVNNQRLEEPYLMEKSLGECSIELPYQVPENKIFVLGDHRSISKDSRDKSIGCVDDEQMVGKLVFRVWPLSEFGLLK